MPDRKPPDMGTESPPIRPNASITDVILLLDEKLGDRPNARIDSGLINRDLFGKGLHDRTARKHLKQLLAWGWVKKSVFPNGYYGYDWSLTDKGREQLARHREEWRRNATKVPVS